MRGLTSPAVAWGSGEHEKALPPALRHREVPRCRATMRQNNHSREIVALLC